MEGAGEFAPAPCVGGHGEGIVLHGGHGGRAGEGSPLAVALRSVKGAGHGLQVADGPAQLVGGEGEREGVPWLQQDALGSHETLADGAIGRLAEVAALRVLQVGAAGHEGELHVREGCPGEDAPVGLFGQVGQDEALPVAVQHVFGTAGVEPDAAALGQGFEHQVDLGVMPQRLKMPHALDGGGNGLLI